MSGGLKTICPHETYAGFIGVNIMPDTGVLMAAVRIVCNTCKAPFVFVGVPVGISDNNPTTSLQGDELRCPIRPNDLNTTYTEGHIS